MSLIAPGECGREVVQRVGGRPPHRRLHRFWQAICLGAEQLWAARRERKGNGAEVPGRRRVYPFKDARACVRDPPVSWQALALTFCGHAQGPDNTPVPTCCDGFCEKPVLVTGACEMADGSDCINGKIIVHVTAGSHHTIVLDSGENFGTNLHPSVADHPHANSGEILHRFAVM